jgi:hypothetical protein
LQDVGRQECEADLATDIWSRAFVSLGEFRDARRSANQKIIKPALGADDFPNEAFIWFGLPLFIVGDDQTDLLAASDELSENCQFENLIVCCNKWRFSATRHKLLINGHRPTRICCRPCDRLAEENRTPGSV